MNAMTPLSSDIVAVRRARLRMALTVIFSFALGGLILPYLHIQVSWRDPVSAAAPGPGLGVKVGAPQPLAEGEAYARAAQAASPAVVNIDMRQRVRVAPDVFDDAWFTGEPRYGETNSQGSGVIIDSTGDILTNEHVVGGKEGDSKKILVTLKDGRKFEGSVIGSDHTSDVALVHIDGKGLPAAKLGTVQGLVPGQMTVAIGNPFGFRFTVTHGVVSALDRPIRVEHDNRVYERLIQTDCAINQGNSGGALINMRGEVIGINTIVLTAAQGIGFAIPIDTALQVAEELKRYGKIKRPWLGINVITNTNSLATRFDLPDVAGVAVSHLFPGSPAAAAGIRQRDILTKINGQVVRSDEDFKNIEKKLTIGLRITIELQREDQRGHGTVTVGEAP